MKNRKRLILLIVVLLGIIYAMIVATPHSPHVEKAYISSPHPRTPQAPLFTTLADQKLLRDFQTLQAHLHAHQQVPQKKQTNTNTITPLCLKSTSSLPKGDPLALMRLPFDAKALRQLTQGSRIQLPNVGSIPYYATITQRITHPDGSLSFHALIDDEYVHYPVIITLSDALSFATLYTPEGAFELQAQGDIADIYAIKDMDHHRINYQQDDTLPTTSAKASRSPTTPPHPLG